MAFGYHHARVSPFFIPPDHHHPLSLKTLHSPGNNLQSLGLQGYAPVAGSYSEKAIVERQSSSGPTPSSSAVRRPSGASFDDKKGSFDGGKDEKAPMHSPSTFYVGSALFVSGSLLTFVAFGFAAQSLLASLEGVQFVSNVVFAKVIRGTPITAAILLGVAMIVGGVAVVVLSGSHDTVTFTTSELMYLYVDNGLYQAFLVIAGGSAVFLRYTEKAYSKRQAQGRPWPGSVTIIPLTYAAFSAIFGTQSVRSCSRAPVGRLLVTACDARFVPVE